MMASLSALEGMEFAIVRSVMNGDQDRARLIAADYALARDSRMTPAEMIAAVSA